MATKIYVDTTGELVIDRGWEHRYPAYSEIQRIKTTATSLMLRTINTDIEVLESTEFGDLQLSNGTAYASFAALKTALDPFFDDVT